MKLFSGLWCVALLWANACSGILVEQPLDLLPAEQSGLAAPKHIAGYFKLTGTHDVNLFYLYFERRAFPENAPVVLWMTGGPGCSSELAVFYENGPYHINKNLTLEPNDYGWDQAASMIYIDQPVGTGFSYSDDPRDIVVDEVGVAKDMLSFLQEFMEAHPELAKRPFYVTGESYGGHYVPAVSYAIYLQNQVEGGVKINLQGIAIGNGLTNPEIQFGAYADYAALNHLIDPTTRDSIKRVLPACTFLVHYCNAYPWVPFLCSVALTVCQTTQVVSTLAATGQNLNIYDIRKECKGQLCYDFSRMDKYLAQPAVRAKLGVPLDLDFQECSLTVNAGFASDYARDFSPNVQDMLNGHLKVLIYAGVEDFICNWLSQQYWLNALPWGGQTEYLSAPEEELSLHNGTVAATVKSYDNLSFIKVMRAGHMVPMDSPEFALHMFAEFVGSKSFNASGVSRSLWRPAMLQRPGHSPREHQALA